MRIKPNFKRESRRYKVKVLEIGAYIELILHLESICKTRLFTSWPLGTTQWFDQMWIKSGDFNGANSVSVRGVTSHIDERNSIRIIGFLHTFLRERVRLQHENYERLNNDTILLTNLVVTMCSILDCDKSCWVDKYGL